MILHVSNPSYWLVVKKLRNIIWTNIYTSTITRYTTHFSTGFFLILLSQVFFHALSYKQVHILSTIHLNFLPLKYFWNISFSFTFNFYAFVLVIPRRMYTERASSFSFFFFTFHLALRKLNSNLWVCFCQCNHYILMDPCGSCKIVAH